jgi:hypothetical protein
VCFSVLLSAHQCGVETLAGPGVLGQAQLVNQHEALPLQMGQCQMSVVWLIVGEFSSKSWNSHPFQIGHSVFRLYRAGGDRADLEDALRPRHC